MALTDSERAFLESGRAAGYSDDELVAKVKERRSASSPSYKLTDYEGEAAKLPSRVPEYQRDADALAARGLSADQIAESMTNTGHLGGTRSRQDIERADNPTDWMTTGILTGTLGAGAGALAAPLGRIAAGAANAGAQTATGGGDLRDIGTSALIGAAIPAAGMAARKIGNAITESRGGQARQLFEKHGGNVGPLDRGSGIPEIDGMEPTRANLGRTGIIAAKNIRQGLADDFETRTGAPYRAARAAVEEAPPVPEAVNDFEPTRQTPRESMRSVVEDDLGGSRARGTSDLRIVDAGRVPADKLRDISPLRGAIADQLYAESTPTSVRPFLRQELDRLDDLRSQDGRVMITERRLNDMRQRLQGMADYGINTGAGAGNLRDRSFKAIAAAAKGLVDEGPYAEPNAMYSEGMGRLKEDRAALGLKKSPSKSAAGVDVEDRRVGQVLRNLGNDSEAAGAMADPEAIAAFVERHPELARQVDLPSLLRAKEALSLHGPSGGGALDNLIQMTGRAGHGVTGKAIDALKHNASAINGRLLYQPGRAASAAGGAVAESDTLNQLIAAYQAQKQREQERAQALGR